MTIEIETTLGYTHKSRISAPAHRFRNRAVKVGRFSLHLLEMLLAMFIGMATLSGLEDLVPANSRYTAIFEFGTNPYDLAMAVFMTVPMVVWMMVRRHGWHHSAEMAFAMFVPLAVIIPLRLLGAETYLPWLDIAGHITSFLAMLFAMLYRRDHYAGKAGHFAH